MDQNTPPIGKIEETRYIKTSHHQSAISGQLPLVGGQWRVLGGS